MNFFDVFKYKTRWSFQQSWLKLITHYFTSEIIFFVWRCHPLPMKDLKIEDFNHLFTAEQGGNISISYTALTRDLSFFGLNWNIDPFSCLLRRYLPDSNLDPHGKVLEPKEILKYSPTKRPKTLKRHLFLFPKVTKSHRWWVDQHSFPKEILLNYKIHFSKTSQLITAKT